MYLSPIRPASTVQYRRTPSIKPYFGEASIEKPAPPEVTALIEALNVAATHFMHPDKAQKYIGYELAPQQIEALGTVICRVVDYTRHGYYRITLTTSTGTKQYDVFKDRVEYRAVKDAKPEVLSSYFDLKAITACLKAGTVAYDIDNFNGTAEQAYPRASQ